MMTDIEKAINELRFQLYSKEVKEQHYPVQLSASDANAILDLLKEQETIVRCKDCKHRPIINKNSWIGMSFPDEKCPCLCDDPFYSWYPKDNWFCGNGERAIE